MRRDIGDDAREMVDPSVTEMLAEPHVATLRALCRTRSMTRRSQSVGQ